MTCWVFVLSSAMQAVVPRLIFFFVLTNCDLTSLYRMKCLHYCADFLVSGYGVSIFMLHI